MNYDKDACRVNSVKKISTVKLYYMTDYIYRFWAYFVNADLESKHVCHSSVRQHTIIPINTKQPIVRYFILLNADIPQMTVYYKWFNSM